MVDAVYFKTNCRVGSITPLHFIHEEIELQEGYAICNLEKAEAGFEPLSAWMLVKSGGWDWSPRSLTNWLCNVKILPPIGFQFLHLKERELESMISKVYSR